MCVVNWQDEENPYYSSYMCKGLLLNEFFLCAVKWVDKANLFFHMLQVKSIGTEFLVEFIFDMVSTSINRK